MKASRTHFRHSGLLAISLVIATACNAYSADGAAAVTPPSTDCISQQNAPVKATRTFSRMGKTQMGTQGTIRKPKAQTASKPACTTTLPKPVVNNTPHNNTPEDAVRVNTTIINGANGNQVIINQVSVPTKSTE